MYISHTKSFNILVSIALATLAHTINVYEICLNTTNYQIFNMQDFRYCLWTSILDCFGKLVSPPWHQIRFYLKSAMYIWKKRKISRKLFTRLYSITNNNKLYFLFKYFGTSLWNRTWKYILVSFRSTAFYSNLVHILQRHFGSSEYCI